LKASSDPKKCNPSSPCLSDSDIDVKEMPLDDAAILAMSWVDSFVIDSSCKDHCIQDAAEFIRYVTSGEVFLSELLPDGEPPAYPLPAKASIYSNPALLQRAHLYPKLKAIIESAVVPSALGLNEQLRNIGRKLDENLGAQ
jgi:hypothetical protein